MTTDDSAEFEETVFRRWHATVFAIAVLSVGGVAMDRPVVAQVVALVAIVGGTLYREVVHDVRCI